MADHLLDKFSKIKLLAFDLDGVLTDGKLLIHPGNEWVRKMDIKDGLAIQMAINNNIHVAVITGSFSSAVEERLIYLGVSHFYQKVKQKSETLKDLMNTYQLHAEQVLFMGDDLPDLDAFAVCGLKTCPVDAVPEIKKHADYISTYVGGGGCVRDVIEKTLKAQDKWYFINSIQSL